MVAEGGETGVSYVPPERPGQRQDHPRPRARDRDRPRARLERVRRLGDRHGRRRRRHVEPRRAAHRAPLAVGRDLAALPPRQVRDGRRGRHHPARPHRRPRAVDRPARPDQAVRRGPHHAGHAGRLVGPVPARHRHARPRPAQPAHVRRPRQPRRRRARQRLRARPRRHLRPHRRLLPRRGRDVAHAHDRRDDGVPHHPVGRGAGERAQTEHLDPDPRHRHRVLDADDARDPRRGAVSIREKEFVDAARLTGCTNRRILSRHILPHLVAVDPRLHQPRASPRRSSSRRRSATSASACSRRRRPGAR